MLFLLTFPRWEIFGQFYDSEVKLSSLMSPSKVYKWPPTNPPDPGFSKYRNEMVSAFRLKHVTIRQAARESFFLLTTACIVTLGPAYNEFGYTDHLLTTSTQLQRADFFA